MLSLKSSFSLELIIFTHITAEYVLTIPGDQFHAMRDSGILGEMLDTYQMTESGEYHVVLNGEQYQQFQSLINHEAETVSQGQG